LLKISEANVQDLTNASIVKIDEAYSKKEKEIMTV
jgi:ribosome recycling factor